MAGRLVADSRRRASFPKLTFVPAAHFWSRNHATRGFRTKGEQMSQKSAVPGELVRRVTQPAVAGSRRPRSTVPGFGFPR